MSKFARYRQLVASRKACRACASADLVNPSAIEAGTFDSEHLGPWSMWQGNLDAWLMVVGQDWGDERCLVRCQGHDDLRNPTNRNLVRLLGTLGLSLSGPECENREHIIFLTNAVLCMKRLGGLQGPVHREWFDNCGSRFLKPLIEIVAPQAVVTLGWWAVDAVLRVYGLPAPRRFRDAVDDPHGIPLPGDAVLFPMYHCGTRVLNTHRHWEQQVADWARLRQELTDGDHPQLEQPAD